MTSKPTYEELEQKNQELEARISSGKFAQAFMVSPYAVVIVNLKGGLIIEVNKRFCEIIGLVREDILGRNTVELGMWEERKEHDVITKIVERDGRIRNFEVKNSLQGNLRHGLYSAEKIMVYGEPCVVSTIVDVEELKGAQEAVFTGKITADDADLEIKARALEEVNNSLRILMEQAKKDVDAFEQRFLANVEDLVMPYVDRLKNTPLDINQRVYLNVVETNLSDLVAPFMRMIGEKHNELTPREIEVANLVRMGATSKEIANLLDISKRAVEFHRDSLRNKLGLKKSKKNLRAYLASLN